MTNIQDSNKLRIQRLEARLAQSKKIPIWKFDLDAMLHFER